MAADGIGSVSVEVVPSADNFWRRFQAQTRGGAVENGRRSGEDWNRGFQGSAGRQEITVRTNTKQAERDVGLLRTSILALAPAAVPLAGAAALAGGALVALGATAAVVVGGIKRDIKAANADGLQFSAGLNVLKDDLHGLEQSGAHNALGVFQQSVAKLHAEMPAVNADLTQSSKVLGDIAGHVLSAAVGGLHTFAPALLSIETQVDHLAAAFDKWANGPGGAKFAAALSEDFNHVAPLIEHLAGAIAHVVAAGNVPGLVIVDELNTFSKVLESIPIPILTGMISTLAALKTASLVSGLMDKLALSIRGVAVAEGEAAAASSARGGLAGLVGVVGKIGAVYLGARVGIDAFAKATDGARTSSDTFSRTAAQTVHALDELVHLNLQGFGSYLFGGAAKEDQIAKQNHDLAASYGEMFGVLPKVFGATKQAAASTAALNAHQVDLTASLVAGHAVFDKLTVGEEIASERTKDLAANAKALAGVFDQLHGKLGGGAQITQVAQGFTQAQTAVEANIESGEKFLKLGGETIDTYHGVTITLGMYKAALAKTGSDAAARGFIQAQIDALGKNKDALVELGKESQNIATYVSDAGTKYKLTAGQIDVYTAALGLNIAEIAKGGSALKGAEAELGQFVSFLKNGNTALDGWLAAVAQFSQSADTAADRAALIGAALRAANGDTLAYQNTLVGAAQANQQLVTDFVNLKDGVVDLRRGTIDFHNAAAAPLLGDLQNLQTAAMNSAAAVYQHYTAVGDASAGDKAFKTYVEDTQGALIGQAGQLGITKGQAKKLADEYFGIKNSGDLKKQIELIGQDKVLNALKGILADLDILAGKHVKSFVDIETTLINKAAGSKSGIHIGGNATGTNGRGLPDGVSALGERGAELAIKSGSHVEILSNSQSRAFLSATGMRAPGFAGGTDPTSPFDGVDYSGNADKNGKAKSKSSGSSALDALLSASRDLSHAAASSSSSAADIRNASQSLNDAAKAAKVSQAERAALTASESRLTALAARRDRINARLGTAPTPPTAYERLATAQQNLASERSTVRDAITGTFSVAQAGTSQYGEPVTFTSINLQLKKAVADAGAFHSALRRLAREGLNKTLLQQLAEAGPAALPQARALLAATPKQLAAFDREFSALSRSGKSTGSFIAHDLYQSGVDAAEGLVRGLRSKRSALTHEMRVIGKEMAAELRSSLGIHSPSRVMHEIGMFSGEGFRLGIASKHAAIVAEARRMGNAAAPTGLARAGLGGQTVNLVQNIHNPIPEPPSRTTVESIRRATYALGR